MRRYPYALIFIILASAASAAEFPLVVQHLSGQPLQASEPSQPVSWGLPLPRNAVTSASQLRLVGPAGKTIPCQFDVMATWDQGKSPKWVLLSFMLDPKQAQSLKLVTGDATPSGGPSLQLTSTPAGYTINTGAAQCTVLRQTGMLDNLRPAVGTEKLIGPAESYLVAAGPTAQGRYTAGPAEITVTRQGPQMATLRCEGWYEQNGQKLCKYLNRLSFFAGSPIVKISQTFIMTEQSGQLALADLGLKLPLAGEWSGRFGLDGQPVAAPAPSYLVQDVPGQWTHLALTWDAGAAGRQPKTQLFINGIEASATILSAAGDPLGDWTAPTLTLGGEVPCAIDDLRISNTVRYTKDFPKPGPLAQDANTLLLMPF